LLGLPLVDFLINAEEIIKDDSDYPHIRNKANIIYRIFENHDFISSESAKNILSGRGIFFFKRNPDNETYGIISLMHA
jgi:hypothetical protein